MTSWSRDDDGALVVVPVGEIDLAVAGELSGAITEAVGGEPDATSLVIDLREVTFMDSTGINCIILGINLMDERTGTVVVRNVAPHIARLIRLVGLNEKLTVLDASD